MGSQKERKVKKINPLFDPINKVLRDLDGRYSAKQASAVLFVANQVANGIPVGVAVETGKGIMRLQGRAAIRRQLEVARTFINPLGHTR